MVLLVVVGFGVYWYGVRDDAPAELTLDDTTSTTASGSAAVTDPAGTWTIQQANTTAGLRIDEQFVGGVDNTAVGRTSKVTGSLTVAGTSVTKADFTVDMTAIEFTDSPPGLSVANRTRAMEQDGLQTSQFPTSSFSLTKAIDLGKVPAQGATITASATGDLTLHGVKRSITFSVQARLSGASLQVVSADPVPVKLSDYDMTRPKLGPVANVSEQGAFEFKLTLVKT